MEEHLDLIGNVGKAAKYKQSKESQQFTLEAGEALEHLTTRVD